MIMRVCHLCARSQGRGSPGEQRRGAARCEAASVLPRGVPLAALIPPSGLFWGRIKKESQDLVCLRARPGGEGAIQLNLLGSPASLEAALIRDAVRARAHARRRERGHGFHGEIAELCAGKSHGHGPRHERYHRIWVLAGLGIGPDTEPGLKLLPGKAGAGGPQTLATLRSCTRGLEALARLSRGCTFMRVSACARPQRARAGAVSVVELNSKAEAHARSSFVSAS